MSRVPLVRACAALVSAAALAACPGSRGGAVVLGPSGPAKIVVEDREVVVPLEDGREARLGASLVRTDRPFAGAGPVVVVVPGGGNVSRAGTRPGDGVAAYERPVDVGAAWAEEMARAGHRVLLYDKRTCGPADDRRCRKNPVADVDAEGPKALARDVDAACALAEQEPGSDGRLVLWAHGQGAQVALASACARRAAAVVLVAPIPRAVDEVIVDALSSRSDEARAAAKKTKDPAERKRLEALAADLKNKAASQQKTFQSMKGGLFEKDARVQGATLAFWQEWIALTAGTPDLLDRAEGPILVVLGAEDVQYAPADRERMRKLAERARGRFLLVEGADHHLLRDGRVDEAAARGVLDALSRALSEGPPPS